MAAQTSNHNQWVHFYIDDYRFERIWKEPNRYLPMLQRFEGVITPDFSLYSDMPRAMQIWNTYRNRALAYWLQNNGVKIIPSVNWSGVSCFDFCFEGIEQGCHVAITSNGCIKNSRNRAIYKEGVAALMQTLAPRGIIHYCTAPESIWLPYKNQLSNMLVIENYHQTVRKKAI